MNDPIDLTKPTKEQIAAAERRGRELMEAWRNRVLVADDWRNYDTRKDDE